MNRFGEVQYNVFMKHLRLFWITLVFCSVLLVACSRTLPQQSHDLLADVEARGHLVIGVKYDSPPFGFMDADGQLKGFEIDLARELARRLVGDPKKVRFVQVNTSTRVATLNARQVDFVLATMTITPQRAKVVNFTKPYYKAAQGVMVKQQSGINALEDLKTRKLIYVIGSTGEANLKQMFPNARLLGFKSSTEAFSAFNAGRADAFSTDDTILYGFLHEFCGVKLLDSRISEEPYGIAFRRDAASRTLQEKVQVILDELAASGFLDELDRRWNRPNPPADCAKRPA